MPFGGTTTIDDVTSGQTAAAFGGTTCHVDFVIQSPGQSFAEALDAWHSKREGKAIIDNGYHMAVTDRATVGRSRARTAARAGRHLLQALHGLQGRADGRRRDTLPNDGGRGRDRRARHGARRERGRDRRAGEAGAGRRQHRAALPCADAAARARGEATNRAIQLARIAGSPLYVVHVSCRQAVEPIARAREQGWDVWGETCTQYFFIDYTHLERPDFEGAKYVYTPPPRAQENQEVLWHAIRSDILSVVSTDHCAFLWDGQKSMGRDDFSKIPNGAPGLENRLHMIHEFGVRTGRIGLNRMVELLSTNPAKLFGLYPRKGTIAPDPTPTSSSSTRRSAI